MAGVMWTVYSAVVKKTEQSVKAKLLISGQSTFLTYGRKLWITTKRIKCKELNTKGVWAGLHRQGEELGHSGGTPWNKPVRVVQASNWETAWVFWTCLTSRALRQTQGTLDRLHLSAWRAGGGGWKETLLRLYCSACVGYSAAITCRTHITLHYMIKLSPHLPTNLKEQISIATVYFKKWTKSYLLHHSE